MIFGHSHLFCTYRKILAPGEEEHLEFEEDDEEGGAGAGSPDSFPARVPGRNTTLPSPVCKFCLREALFSILILKVWMKSSKLYWKL